MNHLVFLDTQAGELEKILSGVKSMILKDTDPAFPVNQSVEPGDCLYFLRREDDSNVRVKATVVRVLFFTNAPGEDLSHVLKEMQPGLQFTEEQYNYWARKGQILVVEFRSAHKIGLIRVAAEKISHRSDWISFEDFSLIS